MKLIDSHLIISKSSLQSTVHSLQNSENISLSRYDLAAKCYRQALQSVKESNLGERERNIKTGEIQGLLKQLRNIVAAINDAMQVSEHFTLERRTEIFSGK